VHDEGGAVADLERAPHGGAVAAHRVEVEVVRHDGGLDAAVLELVGRQGVDRDVPPGGIGGRTGVARELRSLPRQVVVVEHGGTVAEHAGERVGGPRVEWERAHVLDDDPVGALERPLERRRVRW